MRGTSIFPLAINTPIIAVFSNSFYLSCYAKYTMSKGARPPSASDKKYGRHSSIFPAICLKSRLQNPPTPRFRARMHTKSCKHITYALLRNVLSIVYHESAQGAVNDDASAAFCFTVFLGAYKTPRPRPLFLQALELHQALFQPFAQSARNGVGFQQSAAQLPGGAEYAGQLGLAGQAALPHLPIG